jgi:hypothetical protein
MVFHSILHPVEDDLILIWFPFSRMLILSNNSKNYFQRNKPSPTNAGIPCTQKIFLLAVKAP